MLLHFIFVVKESDLESRKPEFEYVKKMAEFYKFWIDKKFSKKFDVQCDEMITTPRNLFQRLDTDELLKDHTKRDKNTYHFYLCHFRPFWTDCTCEGYFAENFGMIWWQPQKKDSDFSTLVSKNCATVSHEITHELLRQIGSKKYLEDVHDVWTEHLFNNLPFESYNEKFEQTNDKPVFSTLNPSNINY